jgi:hypothetical protein
MMTEGSFWIEEEFTESKYEMVSVRSRFHQTRSSPVGHIANTYGDQEQTVRVDNDSDIRLFSQLECRSSTVLSVF